MTFKIQSLVVENFVVFVNKTSIDFSNTLNNIEGSYKDNSTQSNGTGKSLIVDAISLALFGKGIRAQYITDYISTSNPNGGIYIGLELTDGTTTLKIERWRRQNSETNKAKVWKNGVSISQDSTISKIDELIQSYIGVNHTNFISSIFSVMIPGFLKFRPAQRFEILEQALAVKKIESVIKRINLAIKTDEDRLNNTNHSIIETNNKLIAENTKKQIYSSNTSSIIEGIEKYTNDLDILLEEEKQKIKIVSEYRDIYIALMDKIKPLQQEYNNLSADFRALQISKETLTTKLKSVMKAFKRNNTGTLECAICKSNLTEASKESVSAHYKLELKNMDNDIETCSKKIKEFDIKLDKLIATKDKAENAISITNKQLNFIQTNLLAIEKTLKSSNGALENSKSAYSEDLLDVLMKELDSLKMVKSTLEKNIKINMAWKAAMSKNGLRLAYIKQEVSTLSALASKYASALYEKPTQIKFYINDDKDNPTVDFTVNGHDSGMFSTGEGRRLEIAMTLSIMSLLKSSGMNLCFLILDEAMDGLSVSSKQAVLKVIDALSSNYQLLMISHDPNIQQRQGHIISICKDNTTGTSTVSTSERL